MKRASKAMRKAKICKICGVDAGAHPGRHMQRHHDGLPFQKLEYGDDPDPHFKRKEKRGGNLGKGQGFQKGNKYAEQRWIGKRKA